MKLDIGGEEHFAVPVDRLWQSLNDPEVLTRCIPGCQQMIAESEDRYRVILKLQVASIGGSFEGTISLSEKTPPNECRISVSGSGTLGQGTGHATFSLMTEPDGRTTMRYAGEGEMGGLVVGVGQRVLKGVAKHLIGRFFTALRKEAGEGAAA